MQQTELSALRLSLAKYFVGHQADGLFMASLDHSPTEQLNGKTWHTSALVLSAAVEHSALAHELGRIANPQTKKLTKWAKANPHYRRRFHSSLMPSLDSHRVMVLAISATETIIAENEDHFVSELGASRHYTRYLKDGRARVSMGPVVNANTGEKSTFDLPGNQGPMVVFIAHYLRRMHQEMQIALSLRAPMHVTWNFLADKPPGGSKGPFDQALSMLLGLANPRGSLRWGYFLEGDTVETDLLADNIAGLLNEIMLVPKRYASPVRQPSTNGAGFFYWERWMKDSG